MGTHREDKRPGIRTESLEIRLRFTQRESAADGKIGGGEDWIGRDCDGAGGRERPPWRAAHMAPPGTPRRAFPTESSRSRPIDLRVGAGRRRGTRRGKE